MFKILTNRRILIELLKQRKLRNYIVDSFQWIDVTCLKLQWMLINSFCRVTLVEVKLVQMAFCHRLLYLYSALLQLYIIKKNIKIG